MVREYLQLTRAHTAPLETVPALIGALLATGGQVTIGVVLWGIYGLIYHLAGYGMNSLVDWEKGYDQLDRNKQHHPLNRGTLSHSRARLAIGGLLFVLCALGVGLSWGKYLALASLLLGAVSGVMYNMIGKETDFKFIFISIAHTSVFAVPYLALGGEVDYLPFLLGVLYVFLWVAFQISVSGEIKDLREFQEQNFLRGKLGTVIYSNLSRGYVVSFSVLSFIYAFSLKGINMVVGILLLYLLYDLVAMIVLIVMALDVLALTIYLMRSGRYNRDKRIKTMALIELVTMFILVTAFYSVIGLVAVVTLIVGSVVYLFVFNQIEWGTWLAPDV